MAILNKQIPVQNYEKIRNRIGEILKDEILNQFTLFSDDELDLKNVFSERFIPINHTQMPCLNVMFSSGDYSNMTQLKKDADYVFFIDAYTKAKTTDSDCGDSRATHQLHKILGVCRAIISNPCYGTLGFDRPLIGHVSVSGIRISDPNRNQQDGTSSIMGRLEVLVKTCETTQEKNINLIQEYQTKVKLCDTDKGYIFTEKLNED